MQRKTKEFKKQQLSKISEENSQLIIRKKNLKILKRNVTFKRYNLKKYSSIFLNIAF